MKPTTDIVANLTSELQARDAKIATLEGAIAQLNASQPKTWRASVSNDASTLVSVTLPDGSQSSPSSELVSGAMAAGLPARPDHADAHGVLVDAQDAPAPLTVTFWRQNPDTGEWQPQETAEVTWSLAS